jgi:hypothetical protein
VNYVLFVHHGNKGDYVNEGGGANLGDSGGISPPIFIGSDMFSCIFAFLPPFHELTQGVIYVVSLKE